MPPPLTALRDVMHQQLPINSEPLVTDTFLREYKTRADPPRDIADVFHENTKYTRETMAKSRQSTAEFERPHLRYVQSKNPPGYVGTSNFALPDPPDLNGDSLTEVLSARRSVDSFSDTSIDIRTLSTVLYHAAGITSTTEIAAAEAPLSLRAYPSAGALYPVDLFVVLQDCPDLPLGTYYYSASDHGLRSVSSNSLEDFAEAFALPEALTTAPVMIMLTASFWRSKAKYGPRGYRYILQESGHLAQNLCLVAEGLELGSVPLGGFYDDQLNDWLGLQGTDEAVIYVIAIGHPGEPSDAE